MRGSDVTPLHRLEERLSFSSRMHIQEMAAARPSTAAEPLEAGGVGVKKLEKYGAEFLLALAGAAAAVDLRGIG